MANSSYIIGFLDALQNELGRCGAPDITPPRGKQFSACLREAAHDGKHDNGRHQWGSEQSTPAQNQATAERFRRAHTRRLSTTVQAEFERDPVLSPEQMPDEDRMKLEDPKWTPPPDPNRPVGPFSSGQS